MSTREYHETVATRGGWFDIDVVSDLFLAGRRSDDGSDFIAESYTVWVTNHKGRRWEHRLSHPGTRKEVDPDGWGESFPDLRDAAFAKALVIAENAVRTLRSGGKLDRREWGEIDPAYGSDEYVSQGTGLIRAMQERMEA